VLRFQYQMARVPFQVMEEQLVARMDPQAPARLFYERWLGALDATAGMVLGDPELEQRGAALAERSDALGRAAQLDATATPQQEQADDELKTRRDQAKQDLNHARATKQRKVTATRNAAKDRKDTAAEAGAKRSAAAKQQADEVAASASVRPKQPIAKNRPRVGRARRMPPRWPNRTLTMRRQHAATLQPSAHRPTRSRI
jgi:hypothetical protein